jgi:GTP-binding protein Era
VASDSVSGIQVAFYDTPGFVGHRQVSVGGEEKGRVERSVLTSARSAVADGNLLTLVVIDAAKKLTDTYQAQLRELLQNMVAEVLAREHLIHGEMRSGALARHLASCFTLVLNKVDLVNPKADLLPLTTDLVNMFNEVVWMEVSDWKKKRLKSRASLDVDVFMVSATASDAHTNGLADLRKYLHAASSVQAWDVDEEDKLLSRSSGDVYDDVNCELDDEEFASECIREKIFNFIHKEVPYRVKQVNRVWREEGGILQIQNDLVVKTRSHKKMLIGPKGEILQLITQSAQKDLSEHFGMPVRLTLWVRENTSKNG